MKILFYIFFSTIGLLSLAQENPLKKELFTIPINANNFTTDQLGNTFLWNSNNIWMYSNKGDSIAAFNSRKYGEISHVDATNPYEILVFFTDYNLVLFLDNYLSDNGKEIDLQSLGYDQITNACKSRANGIWIYDAIQQKAIHLNDNFKKDKETLNLSQWFGSRINPNMLLEFNNKLYISSSKAIFIFDHFATFQRKIPVSEVADFQIVNEQLRYFKEGNYCAYSQKDFDEDCILIELKAVKNIRVEKNQSFVLQPQKLSVFSTN